MNMFKKQLQFLQEVLDQLNCNEHVDFKAASSNSHLDQVTTRQAWP